MYGLWLSKIRAYLCWLFNLLVHLSVAECSLIDRTEHQPRTHVTPVRAHARDNKGAISQPAHGESVLPETDPIGVDRHLTGSMISACSGVVLITASMEMLLTLKGFFKGFFSEIFCRLQHRVWYWARQLRMGFGGTI